MSNVEAIIAKGVAWPNTALDYDVPTDDGGAEKILFELGASGHPEAVNFPTTDAGYKVFRDNPEFFCIIEKGGAYPVNRPFDIYVNPKRYLNSMTPRAIPFLERCLEENATGKSRHEAQARLSLLKIQEAERIDKEAQTKERKQREKAREQDAEAEAETDAPPEDIPETPAKPAKKKAKKKKAK